jgi:hypothetical protein
MSCIASSHILRQHSQKYIDSYRAQAITKKILTPVDCVLNVFTGDIDMNHVQPTEPSTDIKSFDASSTLYNFIA